LSAIWCLEHSANAGGAERQTNEFVTFPLPVLASALSLAPSRGILFHRRMFTANPFSHGFHTTIEIFQLRGPTLFQRLAGVPMHFSHPLLAVPEHETAAELTFLAQRVRVSDIPSGSS